MGICLSCLRPVEEDDDEFNERSSLLRGQEFYTDEHIQEELLKKQQRQQELNNIVNDLSEHLIDVSTFLSYSTVNTTSAPGTPNPNDPGSSDKQYPYIISSDEKADILKQAEHLNDSIKQACKIESSEPLYLHF